MAVLALACALVFPADSLGDDAKALYKDGLQFQKWGNTQAALEKFEKAVKADPGYPQPYLAIGRIYQQKFEEGMHNYAEAADAYEHLVGIMLVNPPDETNRELLMGYYYKGFLHLKGGEYKNALMELDKFLEVYPGFTEETKVHNGRGIAYYYLDQYDQAVACFKKALETDPLNDEARFNLRSVFTRVTAYNEALAIYRAGELQKALKRLTVLSSIAPRYLAGRRLEAKILMEMKRPDESISVYREILGFQPDDPETYWMRIDLARALLSQGRREEAKNVLFDNLARFPNVEDQRARMEVVLLLNQTGTAQ